MKRTGPFIFIWASLILVATAQTSQEDLIQMPLQAEIDTGAASAITNQPAAAAAENQLLAGKLSFLADTAVQYTDEGEYQDAERAYLRALTAAPDNAIIRFRLSTLYILMERYTDAIALLEKLANEFPDNALIQNNLAWSYATGPGVRNQTKALRHAREALLLSPGAPSIWNTLAEAYFTAGAYDKALRASNQAIDLQNQLTPGQINTSFTEQHQKIERAQKAFKLFDTMDSKN